MSILLTRQATTTAQYGIWIAQQMAPESPAMLTAEAVELRGPLDLAALSDTVVEVLDNCHSLHRRFESADGVLWQWPLAPATPPLALHDFRRAPDPRSAAQQWIADSLATLCDPNRDILYRSAVLQIAEDTYLWYLQVHHIALDGFGYSLVCQTIAERYSARVMQSALPPLPDWSLDKITAAEQAYKANGGFERDKAFWLATMQDAPAPASIAPPAAFSDPLHRRDTRLSTSEIDALRDAAKRCGQDWGNWMLAAIGAWLAKQSGQQALTFGLPVMNRLGTPAIGVPCMAMNIVPLSLRIAPDDCMQSLSAQVATALRGIRQHAYYRYGWIRMDLGLMAQGKHCFNQAVNLLPFDRSARFAGLQSRIEPISAGPVKDLNISVFVLNAEWQLRTEANPNAYSAERLDALHRDLLGMLRALAQRAPEERLAPTQQGVAIEM
ncbi:condensation domain-containing protein [Uliginosibacterium sediminicola]|uniref:Condensation domain-containing protein n=1 Tax=Uliginosibacterium sediminicola TaxID=2024550 RepID=A0ABU9Z3E9_9RHOO